MRVLVTGATGFIGSHAARALLDAGHEVRLFARRRSKVAAIFPDRPGLQDAVVVGDMTDGASVQRALDGADAVLHAAALVDLERAHAQRVLDTNLAGVENVVGGAHRAGIRRIVYVSSTAALFDPERGPITADHPVAPHASSAYGLSKAQGELFVRGLQQAGAPVCTTYPAGVIGPDDPELSEGNQAVKALLEGPRIVTEGGLQSIDVRDLAAIHRALLEREPAAGRYVAAGHFLGWDEIADLLDELTGIRALRIPVPGSWVRTAGRIGDWLKPRIDFELPLTEEAMLYATRWPGADDAKTLAETGVALRDVHETWADTIRWLYEARHIRRAHAGRIASAQAWRSRAAQAGTRGGRAFDGHCGRT